MRIGLPCSSVISLASASRRSSMSWYASYRYFERSYAVRVAHSPNAAAAASMAACMSATPPSAARPISSPVAGFVEANVAPDAASRHSPLMYSMRPTVPARLEVGSGRVGVLQADADCVAPGDAPGEQGHGVVDVVEVEHLAGDDVGAHVARLDERDRSRHRLGREPGAAEQLQALQHDVVGHHAG